MKKYILLYIFLSFLFSCDEEVEIPSKDFPFIVLNEISSISGSGVTISASFVNGNEIPFLACGMAIFKGDDLSVSDREIV